MVQVAQVVRWLGCQCGKRWSEWSEWSARVIRVVQVVQVVKGVSLDDKNIYFRIVCNYVVDIFNQFTENDPFRKYMFCIV